MQANNDQNWADDGAFWDEAWTDMNHRLDETPPKRKRRAAWWWWYAGGFMALLLVVTPTVVDHVFDDGFDVESEGPPATPPPAPLKAPAPHPAAAPEKEVFADNAVRDEGSEDPKIEEVKASTTGNPLKDANPKSVKNKVPKVDMVLAVSPVNKIPEAPKRTIILPAPPPIQNPIKEEKARDIPTAVNALALGELTALPIPSTSDLPTIILPKGRFANALTLEAGALGTSELTGFYAGAGYRFKLSERWSVPVSLRYRREKLSLSTFPVSSSSRDLVSTPADGSFNNDQDSIIVTSVLGNDIAVDLSSGVLETEALETRIGLQYSITPRLRVGTGISAAYLWRGDLNFRARSISESTALENNLDILRGGFSNFSLSSNGISLDVNQGQLPNIKPLHLRTYVDFRYDLTPRLGLTAGGSLLLQQPDRNEISGVPTGRASLGLRWRLR